jgi:N-acetylmuramidase-like protein
MTNEKLQESSYEKVDIREKREDIKELHARERRELSGETADYFCTGIELEDTIDSSSDAAADDIEMYLQFAEEFEASSIDKIKTVAQHLSIEPQVILGIMMIESAFKGDASRREPHIVRRAMKGKYNDIKYSKEDAEVMGRSYGYFQIMGFHYKTLGYDSPQNFKKALTGGATSQINAFSKFVLTDPELHEAMRKKNWAKIAEIYNGPQYAKNEYDIKLAKAYEKASTYIV